MGNPLIENKPGSFHWAPIFPKRNSVITIGNFSTMKDYHKDANIELNFYQMKNNQNIIGYDNNLLFRIPNDIKYFKEITSQEYIKGHKNIVIMGYNTWKSIPENFRPLKDRINIIITKNHFSEINIEDENIKIFNSFDFCYRYLEQEEKDGNLLGEKFIIGGGTLYNYVYSNY